jgi:pimeloyl-ACP methyl ester carboxylesterase
MFGTADGISHSAHLIGGAAGAAFGFLTAKAHPEAAGQGLPATGKAGGLAALGAGKASASPVPRKPPTV